MLGYLRLQLHFVAVWLREWFVRPPEPVPSPRLRHRVHGSTDPRGYLEVGRRCWSSIDALLREVGRDPADFTAVLDFGCGSGRVVRAIPQPTTGAARTITGVDIDRSAVRWCTRHLHGATFQAIDPQPPTPFADGTFDLVFAVSVFTHFDEAMQFAWLAELRRILKPGGILIASLHGEHHRTLRRRSVDVARGFAFTTTRTGRFKKDGLPDFYQDAQHTRAYVANAWTRYFQMLVYRERGMADHHDAVVLQRPAD